MITYIVVIAGISRSCSRISFRNFVGGGGATDVKRGAGVGRA